MKRSGDFSAKRRFEDNGYDLLYDFALIEASFAAQYGIRLSREPAMSWREFACLLSGLMADTPLGRVVRLRLEKNTAVLRKLSASERRERLAWQRFLRARELQAGVPMMDVGQLQRALAACFAMR